MDTFQVGSVLGMSVRAFGRKFIPFVAISVVFFVPVLLYALNGLQSAHNHGSPGGAPRLTFISAVLSMLAGSFVTAALTYSVVNDMHGQRASIGACVAKGISSLWIALGVAIVSGLAIVCGMVLLIVPGVIFACMYYVAVPAAVIERTSVRGALRRSQDLTEGRKGQVFGLMLLVGVLRIAASTAATAAITVETYGDAQRVIVVQLALDAIFAALSAVVAAVSYCALRAEKEGPVMSHLGTAFERM